MNTTATSADATTTITNAAPTSSVPSDSAPTDSDGECRARAGAYVAELIGDRPETLTWDSTHRLQGHVQIGSRELIVIATHDPSRRPVVLTAPVWDAVRRCPTEQRLQLIKSCAITDHSRLVSVLEADEFSLSPIALSAAA